MRYTVLFEQVLDEWDGYSVVHILTREPVDW